MAHTRKDASRLLTALAHEQGGYFTAKQADQIGYGYRHLYYHETAGNIERVAHGLYRLRTIPPTEHNDLVRLALWSRNRKDVPQAVVSHESALVLHDLAELLPDRVHLTVPPAFRKRAPRGVVLHKAILAPEDVEERTGFRVTTPLRTLLDAAAGVVSQEQLEQAVKDALSRGLVRRVRLSEALRKDPRLTRLGAALGRREVATE